jgi:hypothetical protein
MSLRIALIGSLAVAALCAGPDRVSAADWRSLGPNGGNVSGFAQCPSLPNRMYVLPARLGVHRSDDGGATWVRVDTGLGMDAGYSAIAVSPFNEDLVLIARPQSNEVLRSTDGGVTWTKTYAPSSWSTVHRIAFDPHSPGVVLLAAEGGAGKGIHRSVDGGLTWSLSSSGITTLDPNTIEFHPTDVRVVLAGTSDGAYRSTNWGLSWTPVDTGGNGNVTSLSFCASAPGRVWGIGFPDGVIVSDDSGLTFDALAAPLSCGYFCYPLAVASAPDDPDLAVTGALLTSTCNPGCDSIRKLYRTVDGGQSWGGVFSDPAWASTARSYAALTFDPSQPTHAYLAGSPTRFGLRRSTNSGASWTPWMEGIRAQSILGLGRDAAGTLFARRRDAVGLWTADSADSWTSMGTVFSGEAFLSFEVLPAAANVLHVTAVSFSIDTIDPVFQRSTDGGQTWVPVLLLRNSFFSTPTAQASSPDGTMIYVCSDEGGSGAAIYRRDPGMPLFNLVGTAPVQAAAAAVDVLDPMSLFVLGDASPGEVHLSTDGGVSWTSRSTGLPADSGVDLFMDPLDADRLVAVFQTAGAYRSTDAGLTWTPPADGPGAAVVTAADWDPVTDRVFSATQSSGVYVETLGWLNDALPTRSLTKVYWDAAEERLLLGTGSASIWSLDLGAAVDAPAIAAEPHAMELHASPNPFAGTTRLEMVIPAGATDADLAVYSVDGRRVATLMSGAAGAGARTVTWDGRDDAGRRSGAGVYFARLRAGEETVTRRIVLLAR